MYCKKYLIYNYMNINILYIFLILAYFISLFCIISKIDINIEKKQNLKIIEKYMNDMNNMNNMDEFIKPEKFYKISRNYYKNFYNLNSMFYADDYNNNGRNSEGYNRDGYNSKGFNRYGYNINGYNEGGQNIYGFNENGLDNEGYNESGYKLDKETNRYFDKNGYDKNGYDKSGYDKDKYDIYGYDKNGINKYGFDTNGVNQKLKPNVYQRLNKIFETNPFNFLSDDIIQKRNDLSNNRLYMKLTDEYNTDKKIYGNYKKENDCIKGLPSAYNKYGCNLYNYYNQCVECSNKGVNHFLVHEASYCPYIGAECFDETKWIKENVKCVVDGEKTKNGSTYNKPNNFKCINPPDANGSGFGCYGKKVIKSETKELNGKVTIKEETIDVYKSPIDPFDSNNTYKYVCDIQSEKK